MHPRYPQFEKITEIQVKHNLGPRSRQLLASVIVLWGKVLKDVESDDGLLDSARIR